MKKTLRTKLLLTVVIVVVVILSITSLSCKKDGNQYQFDLFPLKVGNEYYYHHKYSYDDFVVGYDSIGIEKWTVLTDTKNNNDIEYLIEKKFNCYYVNWSSLQNNPFRDTTFNIVKTSHFIITERPSGILLFWDFEFARYYNKEDTTIRIYGSSIDYKQSYSFKADSGLTSYYKSWGLMSHRIRESLIQNSIKTSR